MSKDMENLTANVLVYDNHVEAARQLKVGAHTHTHTHVHALTDIHTLTQTSWFNSKTTLRSGFGSTSSDCLERNTSLLLFPVLFTVSPNTG